MIKIFGVYCSILFEFLTCIIFGFCLLFKDFIFESYFR